MAAFKRAVKQRAATTFHDHLKELRTRAFVVVAVFIGASSLAYNYKDWLLDVLMRPLGGEKLIYLTPAGGFSFIFQVTLYAGIIVTVPVLVYNIFRFIAPVLTKKTRFYSVAVVVSSMVLLAAGVSFGYVFAIPAAMGFLIHFADGFANASLTADSYLGFVMAYTAGLGLLFQLPLILLFIHWIHPLQPKKLLSFERYMVLIAFVAAAIISPTPDVLNQTIIAAPIILMYQVGVIAICVSVYRRKKAAKRLLRPAAVERLNKKQKKQQGTKVVAIAPPTPTTQLGLSTVVAAHVAALPQHTTAVQRPVARSVDGLRRRPTQTLQQPTYVAAPVRPQSVRMPTPVQKRAVRRMVQPGRSLDGVSIILKEVDNSSY